MTQYELSLENIKKAVKSPKRAFDEVILGYGYRLPLTIINGYHTIGTNIFDKEWDLLIILDTCRADALEELKSEYDFITDVEQIWSVGGSTNEWTARTFDQPHLDQINETTYISGQSNSINILDKKRQYDDDKPLIYKLLRLMPTVDVDDFNKSEYVFKYKRWDGNGPDNLTQKTPPRYVTDRGIEIGRDGDHDQLILHYLQPHSPWVANALEENRDLKEYEDDWWGYLDRTGDTGTVWEAYLDDLRYVLDDVELLLNNIDAENVVISADHGEAFGKYNILGHKIGSLHPNIRKVPWVETSGNDTESHTPTTPKPTEDGISNEEIDRRLEALGYKT
jgi:hypothetical protein